MSSIPIDLMQRIMKAMDSRNKDSIHSVIEGLDEEVRRSSRKYGELLGLISKGQEMQDKLAMPLSGMVIAKAMGKPNSDLEINYENAVTLSNRLSNDVEIARDQANDYKQGIDALTTATLALRAFAADMK